LSPLNFTPRPRTLRSDSLIGFSLDNHGMTQAGESALSPNDFSAARDLFFKHDGSRFYMSRNDMEAVYAAYGVPEELEREWLSELTKQKLASLQSPGNGWTIHFLLDHRDCRYAGDVLEARPLGVLWQRIAFVEDQLQYIEMCNRHRSNVGDPRAGIEHVLSSARALVSSCRSNRTKTRVAQLVAQAERARSALGTAEGAPGQ
jgi:hypothetical protein